MSCAKGLRHKNEKLPDDFKIFFFPDFLQISCFLGLASCSSVKKELEWILPIAGEN